MQKFFSHYFIIFFIISSCVTPEQKISLVNATALDDLNCGDQEIIITDLGNDRYSAQCGRRKSLYVVDCPEGPNTCKINRSR